MELLRGDGLSIKKNAKEVLSYLTIGWRDLRVQRWNTRQ